MSQIKVRFGEPEHGWMSVSILADNSKLLRIDASDIYPSLHLLVDALSAMLDSRAEKTVDWTEEPREIEMRFTRDFENIKLEISSFPSSFRPLNPSKAEFAFVGTYDEICLPFWRALRNLEGRYLPEDLVQLWTEPFPYRELALLTEQLGKS